MRRGYVISWFYPPNNSSEGICTYKLLKYSQFQYTVFTQNQSEIWTYGMNETQLVSDNVDVVLSKGSTIEAWVEEAVDFFKEHSEEFDFIMSRTMGWDSIEVARRIKELYPSIPWIASFGDPVNNNPYGYLEQLQLFDSPLQSTTVEVRNKIDLVKDIRGTSVQSYFDDKGYEVSDLSKLKNRIEKDAFENADCIIMNNKFQKQYMLSQYSEDYENKCSVIPHSYDTDLYKEIVQKTNEKITFVYLGHLDFIRTPLPLFKALIELNKKVENLSDKISFEFYGNLGSIDSTYLVDNHLDNIVKVNQPVSYLESLSIMQEADWCLMLDANLGYVSDENIFYAGKLADYLGSKSQLFTISMEVGESADITRETGGVFCTHSVNDIYLNLYQIVENDKKVTMKNLDRFNNRNTVKIFDAEIESLIGEYNG